MPSLSPRPRGGDEGAGSSDTALVNEQQQQQQQQQRALQSMALPDAAQDRTGYMEFRDYLHSTEAPELLNALTISLLREKPDDVISYVLSWLRSRQVRGAARGETLVDTAACGREGGDDGDGSDGSSDEAVCSISTTTGTL